MKKRYQKIGSSIIVFALVLTYLIKNAPESNYKNPKQLPVQEKHSMMFADEAVEKIAKGTAGQFEGLYFGNDQDHCWNIINPREDTFFDEFGKPIKSMLISSINLKNTSKFDEKNNIYKDSILRQKEIELVSKMLAPIEQEAIFNTTLPGGEVIDAGSYTYIESELFGDKFFAPTVKIMSSSDYGLEDRHYRQQGNYYWLSSMPKDKSVAGYISKCGVFTQINPAMSNYSVMTVANLNPDAVLFFSSAKDGKVSDGIGSQALKQVSFESSIKNYRLTLKDTTQTLHISNLVKDKKQVSFDYHVTGQNNRLSAIVVNKEKKIIYYGHLADLSSNKDGQAKIELPADYQKGYHLYGFSEQYNGDYQTDYASKLVKLS